MSLEHLSIGSSCPPLKADKLRIYAMRFCPYAQRALLASAAKKVPTDIVYVNLKDKPEWIFDKNPGGKVPTLERADGKVLYESLIVADYLDEAYPGRSLRSKDPFQNAADRIVIENFGKVGGLFYRIAFLTTTPIQEIPKLIEEYEQLIKSFSDELARRGTKYFGGDETPGMLDYMIWPWFERRPVIELAYPDAADYPQLKETSKEIEEWVERMKQDEAVQQYFLTPEVHQEYNQTVRSGNPDFNMLFKK